MRAFKSLILVAALSAFTAEAQFSPVRSGKVTHYRASVGTTTAVAIPPASILPGLNGWSVCNDAVPGSSTYLMVGTTADAATDGLTLLPGACYECPSCSPGALKQLRVKGQAASNGYAVIQFRQ